MSSDHVVDGPAETLKFVEPNAESPSLESTSTPPADPVVVETLVEGIENDPFDAGLSLQEASYVYGYSKKQLLKLIDEGRLPAIQVQKKRKQKWRVFPAGIPSGFFDATSAEQPVEPNHSTVDLPATPETSPKSNPHTEDQLAAGNEESLTERKAKKKKKKEKKGNSSVVTDDSSGESESSTLLDFSIPGDETLIDCRILEEPKHHTELWDSVDLVKVHPADESSDITHDDIATINMEPSPIENSADALPSQLLMAITNCSKNTGERFLSAAVPLPSGYTSEVGSNFPVTVEVSSVEDCLHLVALSVANMVDVCSNSDIHLAADRINQVTNVPDEVSPDDGILPATVETEPATAANIHPATIEPEPAPAADILPLPDNGCTNSDSHLAADQINQVTNVPDEVSPADGILPATVETEPAPAADIHPLPDNGCTNGDSHLAADRINQVTNVPDEASPVDSVLLETTPTDAFDTTVAMETLLVESDHTSALKCDTEADRLIHLEELLTRLVEQNASMEARIMTLEEQVRRLTGAANTRGGIRAMLFTIPLVVLVCVAAVYLR